MAIALIVAAGLGERLAAGRPKALVELAGQSLLDRSVHALRAAEEIDEIVVALPAGVPAPPGTTGVLGGAVRSESVRLALEAAGPGEEVVVHDAARPLVTPALVREVLRALGDRSIDAAVLATPVSDTIKQVDERRVVTQTLARNSLWAVQTPQAFRRRALERALAVSADVLATASDDAWLVERAGGNVLVVPGSPHNIKITSPFDVALAERLLEGGPASIAL